MIKNDYVAVWLTDSYARLFLGLQKAQKESRWVAAGMFQEDEAHGFWFAIERFEERRGNKIVRYTVSPQTCLLLWEGIITMQHIKKGAAPEIGIKAS